MTITNANTSSYGADLLRYASLKDEADSGPLFFVTAYEGMLLDLAHKVDHAVATGADVRPIILANWAETPEGEDNAKEHAALKAIQKDLRTEMQNVRFATLQSLRNRIVTQTMRNLDTLSGITKLIQLNREVNIVKEQGTEGKYNCFVRLRDTGTGTKEFLNVRFTVTHLRNLAKVDISKIANVNTMTTPDIRDKVASGKQGTPNANKGNAEAIVPSKIGEVTKQLDTALSGLFDDTGKLQGVSAATRNDVMMLACMIYRETPTAEWTAALVAYDALAAKPEPAKVAAPAKPAKVVKKA